MRRAQTDAGSQPTRNLITYPNFEIPNGTIVSRQNLCLNPSMEASGGSAVTVRTNLATDPRATTYNAVGLGFRNSRWFGGNGTPVGTYTLVSGASDGPFSWLTTYARKTWTGANLSTTNGDTGFELAAGSGIGTVVGGWGVSGNTTYSLSVYLRPSVAKDGVQFDIFWHDSTGAYISRSMGTAVIAPAGQWTRVTLTATAPANATSAGVVVDTDAGSVWQAGDTLDATGLLVEASGAILPYFDGSTVRSNLAKTAPSALSGVTHTLNQTFADQTWTRAAVAAGSGAWLSRQMVALSDLVNGRTYTASVTVANDTADAIWVGMDWCDTAGLAAVQVAPGEVRRIKTTNFRATYDNTFRFADLSVLQNPAGPRSILFRDWLVEEGDTDGSYYLGSGDFTYGWTSLANASTSTQRGTATFNRTGLIPITIGWNSVSRFRTGSKSAAFQLQIPANLGNTSTLWYPSADYPVGTGAGQLAPNTVHTWSVWVWVPAGGGAVRCVAVAGSESYGANSTLYDQWERISVTFTSQPSGIAIMRLRATGSAVIPAGTVIYVDDEQMEARPIASAYFNGDTPNSVDFTTAWLGIAHSSASEERATKVAGFTGIYSNRVAWQSAEWSASGSKSIAIAGGRPSVDAFTQFEANPISGTIAGKTYTVLGTFRTPEPFPSGADGRAWSIHVTYNVLGGGTRSINIKPSGTTAGVHSVRGTFNFPWDATTVTFMRLYNGSPNDIPVWWDNVMIVEGDYSGDYVDGSMPLAKWDGTANSSTSVGYAAQFYDLAGKPMASVLVDGTMAPISGGALDDCTIYIAYEAYTPINEWTTLAAIGGFIGSAADYAGKGAIAFGRAGASPFLNSHSRYGTSANSNQAAISTVGGWTPGRHVVAMSLTDGLNYVRTMMDGAPDSSRQMTPGNGIAREFVKMRGAASSTEGTLTTGAKTLALHYYPKAHDAATKLAISRYLGNKYGANVA